MMSWRAITQIYSIELRHKLTYRADVLLEICVTLFARAYLSFVVWQAVFIHRGTNSLGIYALGDLLLYFILVAFIFDLNTITLGFISEDIYRGTLTKYLLMPLSYQGYKIVAWFAHSSIQLLPIALTLLYFHFYPYQGSGAGVSAVSIALGFLACALGNILNVIFYSIIEYLAFWSDRVWSLSIMVHLLVYFAGGLMIPLSALPSSMSELFSVLPLYLMTGFPAELILGHLEAPFIFRSFICLLLWILLARIVSAAIWRRGTLRFGGAGI